MTELYYIDTSTPNDFDTVLRFLSEKRILIKYRDKVRRVISAELTPEQLEALCDLKLEDSIFYGTTPLLVSVTN